MTREPITLGGQRVGRLRASMLLCKESFRFLRADKEILWFPVLAFLLQCFLLGLFFFAFIAGYVAVAEGTTHQSAVVYALVFGVYIVCAFTLALAQAGIAHIVSTRLHGGNATLGEGIGVAVSHAGSLLVWSIITSTVGIILRSIAERSRILGAIVAALFGVMWGVLTYFVVQAIVIDNKDAFAAIHQSGATFRKTWGETLMSNISLGLVFFVAHLLVLCAGIGLTVAVVSTGSQPVVLIGILLLYVVWFIGATLVQSSLDSILRTLLYVYASEGMVPQNFNKELLDQMLVRSAIKVPQSPTMTPTA